MGDDVLDRLRQENPVPGRMEDLPLEAVLVRIGDDSPRPLAPHPRSGSRGPRRASRALPLVASLAVVVAVVAVVMTVRSHYRSTSASTTTRTRTTAVPPRPVAPPRLKPAAVARENVRDTPLELFQRDPGAIVTTAGPQSPETVIPSTVRELGTFTVPGVGRMQYWVADTRQHGICGALRLPDDDWAGFDNAGLHGGQFPACYPTRRQVGAGALIIDGFDFLQTTVPSDNGQRWYILYGAVSATETPVRVLDTVSKRNASLVRDSYFAIALHPVGNDYGDDVHLEAFDAAGQRIANQGQPLPGTPTVKCVGRYDVRHVPIPGTHRTALEWKCRRYVKVLAK